MFHRDVVRMRGRGLGVDCRGLLYLDTDDKQKLLFSVSDVFVSG